MNPGKYDRLCTVLKPVEDRGTAGGVATKWVTDFQFWAKKSDPGSREFRAAGVTRDEVSAVFTTHFNPALRSEQRFECEGVQYEVVGDPVEIDRGMEHSITAKSVQTPVKGAARVAA